MVGGLNHYFSHVKSLARVILVMGTNNFFGYGKSGHRLKDYP